MHFCSRCGTTFATVPHRCPGCGFHLYTDGRTGTPPTPVDTGPGFWQQFREASLVVKILASIGLFIVCGIPTFGGLVLLVGTLLGKFGK